MKSAIRLALLALASTSASAFAQDSTPQCAALFDRGQDMFTARDAPFDALNRQCFLTVMPKDGAASLAGFPQLAQYPMPQIQEGTYEVLLSGGGGGGGSGGLLSSGGGGAGAVPSKTTQYLTPGIYKLTLGTSGKGGSGGGRGGDGNPTSITKAYTNETIAGFRGADSWTGRTAQTQTYTVASTGRGAVGGNSADGSGGVGVDGRGNGGHGGRQPDRNGYGEIPSQAGGSMIVAGITTGTPGMGGRNDGGGGGGAGFGDGGAGKSGDSMGNNEVGNQGGDGFVRLRAIQLAQATPMAAPIAAPAPVAAPAYVAPVREIKKDRN